MGKELLGGARTSLLRITGWKAKGSSMCANARTAAPTSSTTSGWILRMKKSERYTCGVRCAAAS